MERVQGIGGVFLRSRDPGRLARWYAEHLGFTLDPAFTGTTFRWEVPGSTVWALFPTSTTYFGGEGQKSMVNFRVHDLDAMLGQLRAAGVECVDAIEEQEFGRFGWAVDPEGNRFELWQPAPGQ
jgi:predicted enzyme related to lactoylglutathione lyase